MKLIEEVPPSFLDPRETPETVLPLLERWVETFSGALPFAGWNVLLVQHQLSNHGPQAKALIELGADPQRVYLLDIPYTSHEEVRAYIRSALGVPAENFHTCHDYRVLQPYEPYQLRRAVEFVLRMAEFDDRPWLVLDDGSYVLAALSVLRRERWPTKLAIVEQTTRGMIKLERSAAMRRAASQVPLIDVARSAPKRELEPPFIAMSVCASLQRLIARGLGGRPIRRCLVLGCGAIGEQVAAFLGHQLDLPRSSIFVADPAADVMRRAVRHGFSSWDRDDFSTRFDLVIGCSGRSSFGVGDYVYLEDGAVLASASSGAVELSRRDFVELADASPLDDLEVLRGSFDDADLHANLRLRLVDREATVFNAGFPINFDGRLSTTPGRYIQPTPVMMLGAGVQAVRTADRGVQRLDPQLCRWLEREFRKELGPETRFLDD